MPALSFDWFVLILLAIIVPCATWYNVTKLKCECWNDEEDQ